jgi:hypothetical protein
VTLTVRFELRDLWIGCFWDRRPEGLHVFVCLVPCLVFHAVFLIGPGMRFYRTVKRAGDPETTVLASAWEPAEPEEITRRHRRAP